MSDPERQGGGIVDEARLIQIIHSVRRRAPLDAVVLLERESDKTVAAVLQRLDYDLAVRLLSLFHSRGPRSYLQTLMRLLASSGH